MPFDNTIVDEIKDRIDIVDLISDYINLKKAGQNWKGLCPFHGEKTPSFMVNPSKQIFHCFGCHKGGDIFTFIIEHEHLTFPEALHALAERAGISLQHFQKDDSRISQKALLITIMNDAAVYYREMLRKNKNVIDYLTHRRGVNSDVQKSFLLGYAPAGSKNLYHYLRQKGYNPKDIASAGLIRSNDQRDLFFKRIIFPVFSLTGDTIALGGRVLDNSLPKYLNGPETQIFNKRRTLFGLYQARKRMKEKGFAIISEGYFDVIISHQFGLTHTIAPLGTALTQEQARLLKRYTNRAVMVFDGDEAGLRAARRGFGILLTCGLNTKALILPAQEDPDSMLRKQGADRYSSYLEENALSLVDFFLTLKGDKQSLMREILEIVAQMRDNVLKGSTVEELSKKSGIDQTFLLDELNSFKEKRREKFHAHNQTVVPQIQKRPQEELDLLGLILYFPHMIKIIFEHLSLDDFTDRDIKALISKIPPEAEQQDYSQEKLLPLLMSTAAEGHEKQIISELSLREDLRGDYHNRLELCIRTVKRKKLERKIPILIEKIKEAQMKKDYILMQELQAQQIKLLRESHYV